MLNSRLRFKCAVGNQTEEQTKQKYQFRSDSDSINALIGAKVAEMNWATRHVHGNLEHRCISKKGLEKKLRKILKHNQSVHVSVISLNQTEKEPKAQQTNNREKVTLRQWGIQSVHYFSNLRMVYRIWKINVVFPNLKSRVKLKVGVITPRGRGRREDKSQRCDFLTIKSIKLLMWSCLAAGYITR